MHPQTPWPADPALVSRPPGERADLEPLFADLDWPRPIIEAGLEGEAGEACAAPGPAPAAAALRVQVFTILGGDPASPAAARLIDQLPGDQFAIGSAVWRDAIRQRRGRDLEAWYWVPFDSSRLDAAHLRALAASAHAAYQILPLDEHLLAHLWPDLAVASPPHGFRSDAELLGRGFGYCAVVHGQVVSAALTFTRSRRRVEIQINTHQDHRHRGLGTAVCAALVLRCLEEGLAPHWSAANRHSEGLAAKLGFVPGTRREVLYLPR